MVLDSRTSKDKLYNAYERELNSKCSKLINIAPSWVEEGK